MSPHIGRLAPRHRVGLALALLLPIILAGASILEFVDGLNAAGVVQRVERANAEGAAGRLNAASQVWLTATDRGLAEAELERRAGDILRANRMIEGSMTIVPSGTKGAISLDVSATGSLAGLRRALFALETGRPVVFVRQLEIRQGTQPNDPNAPMPLEVRMRLEAFGHPEGGT